MGGFEDAEVSRLGVIVPFRVGVGPVAAVLDGILVHGVPEFLGDGLTDLVGMQKVADRTDWFPRMVGQDAGGENGGDPAVDQLLAPRFDGSDLGVRRKYP